MALVALALILFLSVASFDSHDPPPCLGDVPVNEVAHQPLRQQLRRLSVRPLFRFLIGSGSYLLAFAARRGRRTDGHRAADPPTAPCAASAREWSSAPGARCSR